MAHKGKLAPVLFRRDFNLNVFTNDDGWARRAIVHWAQLPTGPGGIWSNSTWDCGPDQVTAIDTVTWESDHVRKFGIVWWTQFVIQIPGNFDYNKWIRMQTDAFGLVLEITYERINFPRYGPSLSEPRAVTVWQPGIFDNFPAGALESTFRPKFWADGPPH